MVYCRPHLRSGPRPDGALALGGGALWFAQADLLSRGGGAEVVAASALPSGVRERFTVPRGDTGPALMGILNTTPDSFSDGGQFNALDAAVARAVEMVAQGADIIDIGGESTRPGAQYVDVAEEINRTAPVIAALRAGGVSVPISIDTRKAQVAEAALQAGATHLNDVSALTHDPFMSRVASKFGVPVCLMHAQGDPATMQQNPDYDDVLFDVFDHLEQRICAAEGAGIDRSRIIIDPGIGFGKTQAHNMRLLRNIAVFHGLGCPILLGVSRKKFIGTLTGVARAEDRVMGSVAIALDAVAQGVQVLRVHDIEAHRQALAMWRALHGT